MLNKMPTPAMGGGGSSTASGTSFDNTTAQLPNNPDNVQNAIEEVNDKSNYYSNEIVIGTYLGKPLYRQVHEFISTGTGSYGKNYDYDFSNIDTLVKMQGVVINDGLQTMIPFYYSSNEFVSLLLAPDGIYTTFKPASTWGNMPVKLIMEYTKNTD